MKNPLFILWFLVLLLCFNGCKLDNLDFNKLSDETNLNPSVVAPVANANISVWDLVHSANKNSDTLITKDPSGLVKIVYKQNDLFTYNVRDFLNFPNEQKIPSEEKQLGEISPGNISATRKITLTDLIGTLGGSLEGLKPLNGMTVPFPAFSFSNISAPFNMDQITDYKSITLSSGTLGINLENNLKVPVTIKGSFFDIDNNQEIIGFAFDNIAPNGTLNKSVPLAGVKISNNLEFRMLTFETAGSTSPVAIKLDEDHFKLTLDMKDLKISDGNLKVKSQTLGVFSGKFDFKFPEPKMKAFSTVLKNGTLVINTTNKSKLTGSIKFTLPEIKKNGIPVEASIPLNGNSTTIDLSGADINFSSDPLLPYNRIPYSYLLQINNSNGYIDYASTDAILLDIKLTNLEFKSISGDFGKRAIQIDPGFFDLNVDMLNKIDGNFKLANPNLILTIHNSIGMPASVNMNFAASNKDGVSASLNPPVFDIPVPANLNAGIATKNVLFDKGNSNVVNFIALPPTGQISYSGQVDFNKTDPVTPQNPNFLDVGATFAIDLAMELPMELQINKLAFRDTTSISGNDYDKIETADLIINASNGIPLDIDLQLLFVDTISKKQFGASKITKILSSAQVSASGIITPVQSTQTFSLDQSEMNNLRKANGIVFIGTVSSPNAGATVAPIMSDSKLKLSVVIKSKVNL